ncbi:MAG TPA: DUF5666 domain-containing protein [Gemmatimonadaceae bacterium]|nr:DUF5666 domain-containing protein [Gemmatimonadaceae bacterium]
MAVATAALAACSNMGSLGSVLGSVLGGGGGNQVDGTVQSVDTRNQSLALAQSNGQNVSLQYDNNTRVLYQNRSYSITSLDPGDQVSAYIEQLQNGGYYADSVVVVQPVNGSTTNTGTANVQSLQGTVREVNRNNAQFSIDAGNGTTLTVTMPYNANAADVNRFNSLRAGDYVRFYGVYVTNSRVELRQFY